MNLTQENLTLPDITSNDVWNDIPKSSLPNSSAIFLETKADEHVSYSSSYFSSFRKELEYITILEELIERGEENLSIVYSYRSVSQAIPELMSSGMGKTDDEESSLSVDTRSEIYSKIIKILRPEMRKVRECMLYALEAINATYTSLSYISYKIQQKESIPEQYFLTLIRLLDILIILDNIKDKKVSITKDFIRYKRTVSAQANLETLEELSSLQNFLANQDSRKVRNYIFQSLLESVERINGYHAVFLDLLEYVVSALENHEDAVLPNERYSLLRVLPYLLVVIDYGAKQDSEDGNGSGSLFSGNGKNIYRSFSHNKVKHSTLQKHFQTYPVVPLYGDMYLFLETILLQSPSYDRQQLGPAWGFSDPANSDFNLVPGLEYHLSAHWETIRNQYSQYTTKLVALMNVCADMPALQKHTANFTTFETSRQVYLLLLEGVSLLSNWQFLIINTIVWKASHPCSWGVVLDHFPAKSDEQSVTPESLPPAVEYARMFKYNMTTQEVAVLVDCIFMVKSVVTLLLERESLLAPFVHCHTHRVVQQFVQGDLIPLLHRLDKRNKPILSTLLQIRSIAADWDAQPQDASSSDYKDYSRRQGRTSIVNKSQSVRVVAPTIHQLVILKMEIAALLTDNSEVRRRNSIFSKSDLEKDDIALFESLYLQCAYFPYALNYSTHLREDIGNFSFLWMREFSLELTRCIQYPVEYSLPWLCVEHVLSQSFFQNHMQTNVYFEKLLFLLDIYNDTAAHTFSIFHKQSLYEEVEAECNLVTDQLNFFLCEEIYLYYKQLAAEKVLSASLLRKFRDLKGNEFVRTAYSFLPTMLQQKTFQLLGRTINFTSVILQSIHGKLMADVDVAIKRFESLDVCNVVEFKTMLKFLATTHSLLSQHLTLDSFDAMLLEMDESFSPVANRGRISMHILNSLAKDIFPNFVYNHHTQRMIPGVLPLKPWRYGKGPKSSQLQRFYGNAVLSKLFEMQNKLTRQFFGINHIEALLSLDELLPHSAASGEVLHNSFTFQLSQLPMVLDQLIKNMYDKILDVSEYLDALIEGIPPCKPPQALFRSVGAYGYYEGKLKALLDYDDLKPEVFQNFREIGNSMVFFKEISNLLERNSTLNAHVVAYLFSKDSTFSGARHKVTSKSSHAESVDGVFRQLHADLVASLPKEERIDTQCLALVSNISKEVIPHMVNCQELGMCLTQHKLRSFFFHVLQLVEEFFYQQNITKEWSPYSNNFQSEKALVIEIENSKTFAKLWSALTFLFNVNESNKNTDINEQRIITNSAEFGDGFHIAGCLFLHILDQKALFELLNYSSQVLSMREYENAMGESITIGSSNIDQTLVDETKKFLSNAAAHHLITTDWFGYLGSIYESRKSYTSNSTTDRTFLPPSFR